MGTTSTMEKGTKLPQRATSPKEQVPECLRRNIRVEFVQIKMLEIWLIALFFVINSGSYLQILNAISKFQNIFNGIKNVWFGQHLPSKLWELDPQVT